MIDSIYCKYFLDKRSAAHTQRDIRQLYVHTVCK